MISSNPILNPDRLESFSTNQNTATYAGVVRKSLLLFIVFVLSALFISPHISFSSGRGMGSITVFGIAAFIIALIFSFKPHLTFLAPIYASLEGVLMLKISLMVEQIYPGIVYNALGATLIAFLMMLFAYRTHIIRVTPFFVKLMLVSMGALFVLYLGIMIAHLFKVDTSAFTGNGNMSIGISIFAIAIATFSLALDFKNIEDAIENKVDKKYEWYLSFGLMVTLIWLYIEILNLLSKLRSRD